MPPPPAIHPPRPLRRRVQCRSRFWLFIGYSLSFGAIGSAIVFLILDKQKGVDNLWVGTVSVDNLWVGTG